MKQSPIEKHPLARILLLNIPDQPLHDLKFNFIGRNLKKKFKSYPSFMNIFLLGFIEAKSNLCHTPRWNMKLKSVTQIEGCIIHREPQVATEVCDFFYQDITGWPSLISHSFSVAPIVSLFVASFIFLIAFHLYSSPALHCDSGKTSAKGDI